MSPESVLQKEPFCVLAITLIPGGLGTFTWVLFALEKYSFLRELWVAYRVEIGLLYFVAVVLAGMVFEDLGSQIEVRCFDKNREKIDANHTKNWREWLQLKAQPERNGAGYIEATVVRFKFELNMVPACAASLVGGILLLSRCPPYTAELLFGLVFLLILGSYLYVEARWGHELLADLRRLMLEAEKAAPVKQEAAPPQNNL